MKQFIKPAFLAASVLCGAGAAQAEQAKLQFNTSHAIMLCFENENTDNTQVKAFCDKFAEIDARYDAGRQKCEDAYDQGRAVAEAFYDSGRQKIQAEYDGGQIDYSAFSKQKSENYRAYDNKKMKNYRTYSSCKSENFSVFSDAVTGQFGQLFPAGLPIRLVVGG